MSSLRSRSHSRFDLRRLRAAPFLLLCAALGCREAEQIRTYEVDRKVEDENEKLAAQWRSKTQVAKPVADAKPGRLLGALLPHGEQTWSFKVLGDIEAVSRQADAVKKFVESVKFDGDKPSWTIPPEWRTKPVAGPMRYATLLIDDGQPPLELAISALPSGQNIAENVNRWRGQVQQPPLQADAAEKSAVELTTGAGPARWVDVSGAYSPGGGMAPFAGGAAGRGPAMSLPADHPPLGAAGGPAAGGPATLPADLPLKFQAPAEWQSGPATQFSVASFIASYQGKEAKITLSNASGDLLSNVNRWRQQIQLPPIDQTALEGAATKLKIDGRDATYIEIIGQAAPEGQQAIYGVVVVQSPGQTWFVKMMGDAAVAFRERERFLGFVSSFRFEKP